MKSRTLIFAMMIGMMIFFSNSNMSAQTWFEYQGYLTPTGQPAEAYFKDVVLGDVDNDGDLDILAPQKQQVANVFKSNIDHLYINNGNLSFTLKPINEAFPTPFDTRQCYDAEFVDLDNDGNLDIVRPDRERIYILYGNGAGVFADVFQIEPFSGNYDDATVADIDGDGDMDFIIANYSGGASLIYLNKYTQSNVRNDFTIDQTTLINSGTTHSVSLGDYDNNGKLDLTLANHNTSKIYTGNGTGGFTFFKNLSAVPSIGVTPVGDFIDLDQNGLLDLFMGRDNGTAGILFHSGNNSDPYSNFTQLATTPGPRVYDARYDDVDGDGDIEIITVNCCGSSVVTVYARNTAGNFVNVTNSFVAESHGGFGIAVGDLDGDLDLDLITGGTTGPADPADPSAVHIYKNILSDPPSAPQNLTPTIVNSAKNPRLDWNASVEPDLKEYEVWKNKDNGGWNLLATTTNAYYIDYSETGVDFAQFSNNIEIKYKLKAVDMLNNKSNFSSTVTFNQKGGA